MIACAQVFEGIDMSNEDTCVIKVLKPVAKKKIKREIKILRNLSGGPNVVGLLDVVHDPPSQSNSLIMEYVDNTDWKELFNSFTEVEIKHYVFQLLDVRRLVPPRAQGSDGNVAGSQLCALAGNHAPGRETRERHV